MSKIRKPHLTPQSSKVNIPLVSAQVMYVCQETNTINGSRLHVSCDFSFKNASTNDIIANQCELPISFQPFQIRRKARSIGIPTPDLTHHVFRVTKEVNHVILLPTDGLASLLTKACKIVFTDGRAPALQHKGFPFERRFRAMRKHLS